MRGLRASRFPTLRTPSANSRSSCRPSCKTDQHDAAAWRGIAASITVAISTTLRDWFYTGRDSRPGAPEVSSARSVAAARSDRSGANRFGSPSRSVRETSWRESPQSRAIAPTLIPSAVCARKIERRDAWRLPWKLFAASVRDSLAVAMSSTSRSSDGAPPRARNPRTLRSAPSNWRSWVRSAAADSSSRSRSATAAPFSVSVDVGGSGSRFGPGTRMRLQVR